MVALPVPAEPASVMPPEILSVAADPTVSAPSNATASRLALPFTTKLPLVPTSIVPPDTVPPSRPNLPAEIANTPPMSSVPESAKVALVALRVRLAAEATVVLLMVTM